MVVLATILQNEAFQLKLVVPFIVNTGNTTWHAIYLRWLKEWTTNKQNSSESKNNKCFITNRNFKVGVVIPLIFPKASLIFPNGILRVPQEHPLPLDSATCAAWGSDVSRQSQDVCLLGAGLVSKFGLGLFFFRQLQRT